MEQKSNTPFGVIAKRQAQHCNEMIVQDSDGRYMLDLLGQQMRDLPGSPINRDVVESAWKYILSQYQKYSAEGNAKLSSRYFRLMHYFRCRMPLWQAGE
jgi:hypothetical protein